MGREMVGGNGYCRRLVCIVLESNRIAGSSLAGLYLSEGRDCVAVVIRR